METAVQESCAQEQLTSSEVEQCVLGWLDELQDKTTELHQQFYGALGILPTPLRQTNLPMSGNLNLWKDETSHAMELGGVEYESASFKIRGALLAALLVYRHNPNIKRLVTASHGNHGIGVAMAAKQLELEAVVYCPESVNETKRAKLTDLNATVLQEGYVSFEQALLAAEGDSVDTESAIIYPFDQPEVIAGQATVMLETIEELEELERKGVLDLKTTPITCSVAVAGGGLITGCGIVAKEARRTGRVGDNFRLVGAQMEDCDAAFRAIQDTDTGGPGVAVFENGLNEWCDSTAVVAPGFLTLPFLCNDDYVQGYVVLSEAEVGHAMRMLTGLTGKMIEPAGALAYAANQMLAGQATNNGAYVSVVCGANVTRDTYDYFMMKERQDYDKRLLEIGKLAATSFGHVKVKRTDEGNMFSGVTNSLIRFAPKD